MLSTSKVQLLLMVLLVPMLCFSNTQEGKVNISDKDTTLTKKPKSWLVGGYGEATASRFFYSDNYKRYSNASLYKEDKGYGQVDLPHVVFYTSYDFGKGWKLSAEIEFEHGGTESAIEIESEETGEYESEIERGGEIALEQFWIQKTFSDAANLRMGHIIVPIGIVNDYHLPTQFFNVFRPEGESSILPCTWHETGISFWGRNSNWKYELQMIAGLDADRFGNSGWIKGGAGSPYEFKMATNYAGVFRIDNYSISGLRLGFSGYLGNSASNTLKPQNYEGLKGTVSIGSFDFAFDKYNVIARGSVVYGHLSDSKAITAVNLASRKDSPSPKTDIASDALSVGVEAGYDIFSLVDKLRLSQAKLYIFGRYDYYDSMFKTQQGIIDNSCWKRNKVSFGVNYFPIKNIVIKAEYSSRMFSSQYNTENTFSLGVAYSGIFNR